MTDKHSIEIVSFTAAMHLLAWINHFALNLGSAIASVFYAIVPPQWTGHSKLDLTHLANGNPFSWFVAGLTDSNSEEILILERSTSRNDHVNS
jgi:hypothetical protein